MTRPQLHDAAGRGGHLGGDGRGTTAQRDDTGAGAVLVLTAAALLLAAGVVALTGGSAVVARHRAAVVADLAALGAAGARVSGHDAPCGVAQDVARAHDAVLESCRLDGSVAAVVVTVPLHPHGLASPSWAVARVAARAGPAPPGLPVRFGAGAR